MTRRLVFKHTIEGLFTRAYGGQIPPAVEGQFREMGLYAAAVDAEVFGRAFQLLRDEVHHGLDTATAEREMGARFLAGYFETAMGGLVKVMIKLLSVDQALARVPKSLMSGANFIEAKVVKVADREVNLVVSDYSTSPEFLSGVVSEMVRRAGGTPQIEIIERNGRASVMRVRWT